MVYEIVLPTLISIRYWFLYDGRCKVSLRNLSMTLRAAGAS